MTTAYAEHGSWPTTLAIAIGISCLAALTTLLPGDHGLLEVLGERIVRPDWASLILLLVSLIAMSIERRGLAIASGAAVCVCAAFELSGVLSTQPVATGWLPRDGGQAAITALLGAAILTTCVLPSRRIRFLIYASAVSMSAALYVIALTQAAVVDWLVSEAFPEKVAHLVALGFLIVLFILHRRRTANELGLCAVRWMRQPIVMGAVTAVTGITLILWSTPMLPTNYALVLNLLFSALISYGAFAKIALLGETADNIELRDRATRSERLIRSLHQRMEIRTKRLRKSQLRYKALFENIYSPLMITSPDGEIVQANRAMMDLFDIENEQELREINFADFYENPVDRERFIEEWHNSGRDTHKGEYTFRLRSGKALHVVFAGSLMRSSDGNVEYQIGVFIDITKQRQAERDRHAMETSLRLSQKLESVGRLAAGVAHEINTPMQYIGDNVYFLKGAFETCLQWRAELKELLAESEPLQEQMDELDEEHELEETLDAVPGALRRTKEGIESVNTIVAAMKELAHPDGGAKGSTDLNGILRNAIVMTKSEYKTLAEVETALGDVPPIVAHKNELGQVFINIIVNAAHAIAGVPGRPPKSGRIRISSMQDGDFVLVEIADNGGGIPDAVKDKVFDPFFTTKSVGKGTGQGLAIARATIVDRHGGTIYIDSEMNVGTTFKIRLPINADGTEGQGKQEIKDEI